MYQDVYYDLKRQLLQYDFQKEDLSADPLLGLLADNGGPTLTHLPMAGSPPAIDAGSNAAVPMYITRDQRGPLYPRIAGVAVELGAVEITIALPQVILSDSFER